MFSLVNGQVTRISHRMDRELILTYDNDVVFFTDQYYSSGLNINYSRTINSTSKLYKLFRNKRSDSLKLITHYHYGHKIFTPSKIKERDVGKFDRPYAGWHYVQFNITNFSSVNTANRFGVELGMVGEGSGIGNFHEWWHRGFGIVHPRGWNYEIENEGIVNMTFNKFRKWRLSKSISLISDLGLKFGNGENKVSQDLTLIWGKTNNLINSGYINSRVSSTLPDVNSKNREEVFLFYGFTGTYVLNNIFIEGSLFDNQSLHTEEAEELLLSSRWGFIYTSHYTTFSFTFHRIGKEVVGGNVHRYLSLSLAFRF